MSQYITRYKTENGKTRTVKKPAAKPADKHTPPVSVSGSDRKDTKPETPAK